MDVNINNVPDLDGRISDNNNMFISASNALRKVSIKQFKEDLVSDESVILNELAFYIDINEPVSGSSMSVNVGGNMNMRKLWEDSKRSVLMDANGNYCELNKRDCRYTADGEYILNVDGTLKTAFEHGDVMVIVPATYVRVQLVPNGAEQFPRVWLSLNPLPGGYKIPRLVVGKFMMYVSSRSSSSPARSIPGVAPLDGNESWGTINNYWSCAQARSTNHGLINANYVNFLNFHLMSKYGQRSVQDCTVNGTPVFGKGLDGRDTTPGNQLYMKTGSTLTVGDDDGSVIAQDDGGSNAYPVCLAGFENCYGQMSELLGGVCNVGNYTYIWDNNFMPSTTPTSSMFESGGTKIVEHTKVDKCTESDSNGKYIVNIITSDEQRVYMIPKEKDSTPDDYISYGDSVSMDSTPSHQRFSFGGSSSSGAGAGIMCMQSSYDWADKGAGFTSRLQYYGEINKVSTQRFKELV